MNKNLKLEDVKLVQSLLNLISVEGISAWLMRWWRGIFLISVFLEVIFFNIGDTKIITSIYWLFFYFVYFALNEVFRNSNPTNYDQFLPRFTRIHIDLVFIATLLYVEPVVAFHWFWIYFTMPLLASVFYFNDVRLMFFVFIEVALTILGITFISFGVNLQNIVTIIAKWASLGLFVNILYYLLKLIPRMSYAEDLSKTAVQLIGTMSPSEIVQLLADVAKKGIPFADATVVHLLGGEDNRTLIAYGSSSIDVTALGKSPMDIGSGIAGIVIQTLKTENIPDTKKDPRFHPVPSELGNIRSMLVAPIYIGKKKIGTISVNSSQIRAFDNRDKQFLETLAAQGALALSNAELLEIRSRGRRQLKDILAASLEFNPTSSLATITKEIAHTVCEYSEFNIAVVNLIDEQQKELIVMATAGLPPHGVAKLHGRHIPVGVISPLLKDEYRISQSYFIRHNRLPPNKELDEIAYTPELGYRGPGEWHEEDILIVPIYGQNARLTGYISVDDPADKKLPTHDTVQVLEVLARVAGTAIQNTILFNQLQAHNEEMLRVSGLLHLLAKISATTEITTSLERFLHILLTAITSGEGLRFNRACIFSVDEKNQELVGLIGIGQLSDADARSQWEQMVDGGVTISDYLTGMQAGSDIEWTDVHKSINNLRIPIKTRSPDIFSKVVNDPQLTIVNTMPNYKLPDIYKRIMEPTTNTIVAPLVSQKRVVGLLVCDNKFSGERVEMNLGQLQYFAAHIAAGMENYRLMSEEKERIATTTRRDAIQAERERLQDDLHEAMGMLSTGVKWEGEIIQEELSLGNISNAKIAVIRLLSVFANAYQSLGGVLDDLRDPTLEREGLANALRKRIELMGDRNVVVIEDLSKRLPANIEGVFYRIGLEGISNALKYSGTKSDHNVKISVKLEGDNEKAVLSITDNGVGFDINAALQNINKFGLRRIRDKICEIGGEFIPLSIPGKGTELKFIVPIVKKME